jgi:glycosyltransferase involved in cell wall biosynthesis
VSSRAELARSRNNLARVAADVSDLLTSSADSDERPNVALVCWDLTHNPVGRAYVLYEILQKDHDVDLVGPMWTRFGDELWEPLGSEPISVASFGAANVIDYLPRAVALLGKRPYDLVVCVKPRLPGLHLATLIAEFNDAPLLLDIDDDEKAFADAATDDYDDPDNIDPISQMLDVEAADLAERSIGIANARTVVSRPLQEIYGGVLVRHARRSGPRADTEVAGSVRAENRLRYGIGELEHALFFVGTVRPHKGIGETVEAIAKLGRDDIRLHIFTTTSSSEIRSIVSAHIEDADHLYVLHGPTQFDQLTDLLSAADLVVLAQQQGSDISTVQVPAKISDATAVGCPVLVPESAVFEDLLSAGLVNTYSPGRLSEAIAGVLDTEHDTSSRTRLQDRFESELSIEANRAPLRAAMRTAAEVHARPPDIPSTELHSAIKAHYRRRRDMRGPGTMFAAQPSWPVGTPHDQDYDVAFFWKQNDSGLYGRRCDMVVAQALAQGRIRQAVHFDAAVTPQRLVGRIPPARFHLPNESDFVLANVMDRHLADVDQDSLARRVFIHLPEDHPSGRLMGEALRDEDAYGDFVLEQLQENGMDPKTTLAWIWPVAPGIEHVLETVPFAGVVCDLVDDQRMWPNLADGYRAQLDEGYGRVIEAADIVFTNSPSNAEAFHEFAKAINVVPNGAELVDRAPKPSPLLDDIADGPILGYVGNMRDRVDWGLIEAVAAHNPNWNVVLAGEVGSDSPAFSLVGRFANLHLFGVVPYQQARDLIAAFDVGLIPHVISDQSMRMDPLKLYNFVALDVPVVSTAHPSARAFAQGVQIAETPEEFCAAIETTLDSPRPSAAPQDLDAISWASRVEQMFALVDGLGVSLRSPQNR